ncbi:MAG: PTS sugar transporter subunit IIA, partial [Planctomycetota bacterium]
RESTRTTGIGNGLAIPHGKTHGVKQLVMAIGRPAQGIDFAAVDGKPVNIIWLLSSPPDKTGPHIQALAKISRLMTVDAFRTKLQHAEDAQAMYDMIVKQEEAL